MKWLKWWKGRRNGSNGAHWSSGQGNSARLLDRESFERDLHRHRALCNRAGGRFVLMVFGVVSARGSDADHSALQKLSGIVSRRVRLSDIAGIYDIEASQIGVILASTDTDGAARFLKDVEEAMRGKLNGSWTPEFRLTCEIYSYPEPLDALVLDEKNEESAAAPTATGR